MTAIAEQPLAGPPNAAGAAWLLTRNPAVSFFVRRVAAGFVTVLVTSFLIFLATNALPGNVAEAVLGKHATPASIHLLERQLNLDQPLLERYLGWLAGIIHGDLGRSAAALAQGAQRTSVLEIISAPLHNTIVLAVIGFLVLVPLSLLLGTISALRAGRPLDYVMSYSTLILSSLPEFVLGTFLITVFFTQLDLLPPLAQVPPGSGPLDNPTALVLPILTLIGVSLAFSSRQVRAGVIESQQQNYVVVARLHGIKESRVVVGYAMRNALAPTVQTFAQSIQYLVGGLVVVEALFDYPGIGAQLVQAVAVRDVPVVQGIMLILTTTYIAVNIIADFVVVLLVPKLRTGVA